MAGLASADFEAVERALGHCFRDRGLLEQALTHRSFGTPHNERLEFLGDGVLNCVIALLLYARLGRASEGELSRLRAGLVRQETLFRLAEDLGLGGHILLGAGELRSGGFRRPSILADAFEALLGAILLDAGFEAVHDTIARLYAPLLARADAAGPGKDPKTSLQEWLQSRRHALPEYLLRATHGQAHAQQFEVECRLSELNLTTVGVGSSRRAAEQEAARRAIEQIGQ